MAVAVVVIFIMQPDLKLDPSQYITRSLDLLPNPYVVRDTWGGLLRGTGCCRHSASLACVNDILHMEIIHPPMHGMFRVLWDVQEGNFTNYNSFREPELVLHTLCISDKGNKKRAMWGVVRLEHLS